VHRLPIDAQLPEILARVRESRACVITAAPGAGKTTRVAPALAADGPVILLQPRRVAARSIARWIAREQQWTLGREVGWHIRFERQFRDDTRVLLATEGILTARLQQDPLLSGFRTVILDEFHERSIHADLGLALARQAWLARDDLRIVVMSATLDTTPVAAFLGGCPIVTVEGRQHPLDIRYAAGASLEAAVLDVATRGRGQVLCFLPGAPEIRRALPQVRASVAALGMEAIELHGSLDADAQDAALTPGDRRRVILATNIAETSLTVPGVDAVVDTGLQKVARYDADRGIDSLEVERITEDAADQRAGRAGRLGPGAAVRLWSRADRLRPHREADVHRVDLSGPLLDLIGWGGDPKQFQWFDRPSDEALDAGLQLLEGIGAISHGSLTDVGRRISRLPLHPRLARILVAAGGSRGAAIACALLSERGRLPVDDLLAASERERDLPPHVKSVADHLQRLASGDSRATDERSLRRAVFEGYADRLARRRAPKSPRVLLRSGHGGVLATETGLHDAEFIAVIDVHAGRRGEVSEATVRLAVAVDREWLTPTETRTEHTLDQRSGAVRAIERDYLGAIVLAERYVPVDPLQAQQLLADEFLRRELSLEHRQLVRRLRFAGLDVELTSLARDAAARAKSISDIDLHAALEYQSQRDLDRLAPASLTVPSGRTRALHYEEDGTVSAEVKLQELFGLAETPVVGPRREPVLLKLLAPNGRPVQMTRDLKSFWERTYPEVRKELRGRYPKHPWPDDPWTATPTARAKRR
jgi:ATP-dependent helicase HrpB